MLGGVISASDLDGLLVGDESLFHVGRLVDEGLGCSSRMRRLAEPIGAVGIYELGMRADEGADDQIERLIECGGDGELGRVGEIVGCRCPIDLLGVRRVSPGHSRVFFGRRASASRRR
jgi:hypothetical protein